MRSARKYRYRVKKQSQNKASKQVLGISQSVKRIIIGFDADTDKSGCVVYDAIEKDIMRADTVEQCRLDDWILEVIKDFDKERLFCRIEMPTMATAYGSVEGLKKTKAYKEMSQQSRQKAVFNIVYHSGRCQQVANHFKQIIERRGILLEVINSNDRINASANKFLKGIDGAAIVQRLKSYATQKRTSRVFPTKLSKKNIEYLFGHPFKNEEIRDALGLVFPEMFFEKYLK